MPPKTQILLIKKLIVNLRLTHAMIRDFPLFRLISAIHALNI